MKCGFAPCCGLFLGIAAGLPAYGAQVYYPQAGLVSNSTGLMESLVDGYWYRGSAVIARDPKLLYSCAHLFYESGQWATDYYFHRAYHSSNYPEEWSGASPRGLHYFTSYSSGVKAHGSDSEEAFASDFTVLYGNSSFGDAVGWWENGGSALRSGRPKRIVGYPSEIDYTGALGRCFQHSTPWFNYAADRMYGGYHEFDDVSTGPGNSGGPVFVRDTTTDQDYLAGILVSGASRMAGTVALDLSTNTLAGYALGLEEKTLGFKNSAAYKLPDGVKSYTVIPIQVSGFSGALAHLKFSLTITTKHRGDLDVYVKSPGGRTRWIAKHSADAGDDLVIAGKNLTSTFGGAQPNGKWEIHVRDAVSGSRATFQSASLKVTAL